MNEEMQSPLAENPVTVLKPYVSPELTEYPPIKSATGLTYYYYTYSYSGGYTYSSH